MNSKWNPVWREDIKFLRSLKVIKVPALNPLRFLPVNPFKIFKMFVIPKLSFINILKNYDVIHFHGEADLGFPLISSLIKKPKIFHSHITRIPLKYATKDTSTSSRVISKVIRLVFPHFADLYIGVDKNLFLELGIPRSKSLCVPFGIDTDLFRPDRTQKLENLILFAGRITELKGLHVLLYSLSFLKIPIQLVIIGPEFDKEYTETCLNIINNINKEGIHEIKYLGAMNSNELVPWYQKATVFVRPDLNAVSGGLTCLEALACGTPVIGTGNHAIINGVNGLIVTPNNPKKLAEAIELLLNDNERREGYGKKGRKIVIENFSLDTFTRKLIDIYKTILVLRK